MNRPIPTIDFLTSQAEEQRLLEEAALRVLRSGRYILGEETERFEEEFAAASGKRYAVGVGNGLDALRIALQAGIPDFAPGDEVIVPSQTFIATWMAVSQLGGVPVAVDVDRESGCLDPERVEAAIGERTAAILPVHLFGFAAPAEPLRELADRHRLFLLEDAAQGHGHPAVGRGDVAAYSFYPTKNLGALGDGGAIVTDDPALAERSRALRNYGRNAAGTVERLGWNSRLDELQAALLRVKLRTLDKATEERRRIALRYLREIDHPEIALPLGSLPPEEAVLRGVWHLFPIRTSRREPLRKHLASLGIETAIHYDQTPAQHPLYRDRPELFRAADSGAVGTEWGATEVSLPLRVGLSDGDLSRIIEGCNEF